MLQVLMTSEPNEGASLRAGMALASKGPILSQRSKPYRDQL
jgi:hypothetical protein